MTRRGEPIENVRLTGGVDPQIGYSASFAEWEAAHAANLNLYDWFSDKYPRWFKARVLAWYKLHTLIEMHKQDALAKDIDRKSNANKRGQ